MFIRKFLIISVSILAVACTRKSADVFSPEQVKNIPSSVDSEKYTDPEHGKETSFAIGALSGINDINANGVVQAHQFEDGYYRLALQFNAEPAGTGEHYEAWVLREGGGDPVRAGQLTAPYNDVRHALQFEADRDLQQYLFVEITLEADDAPETRGSTVATGQLTQSVRM